MVAVNELKKAKCHKKSILKPLIQLLAPFAPFISEELWETLGETKSIHQATFPLFDESHVKEDEVTYPVCFNGKKRLEATFAADESRDSIMEKVVSIEGIDKYLDGKTPKKIIVVPGRMINIVI
jgi:leucyl-tRNA synthetase